MKYSEEVDDIAIDLASKYEPQISIPAHKPIEQFILCPVGLLGSGKTTVVTPLAQVLSLVRISGDEIRKLQKDNGYGYERTKQISEILAKKYLEEGYSICVDSDCASPKTREILNRAVQQFNVRLVWIHINPPEEFIINKLRNFKHTWLFRDGEEAVENYLARKELHKNLDMPFVYTFDTSRDDLDEQIIECARIIEEQTGNK